jgi:hypothetical protein
MKKTLKILTAVSLVSVACSAFAFAGTDTTKTVKSMKTTPSKSVMKTDTTVKPMKDKMAVHTDKPKTSVKPMVKKTTDTTKKSPVDAKKDTMGTTTHQ